MQHALMGASRPMWHLVIAVRMAWAYGCVVGTHDGGRAAIALGHARAWRDERGAVDWPREAVGRVRGNKLAT